MAWKIRGAILIGILGTTALGVVFGLVRWQPQTYSFQDITATAFHLNIRGALSYGLVEIVFVFLFVDLFDNIGTLVAVGKQARLFDRQTRSRASTGFFFPMPRRRLSAPWREPRR